MPPKRMTANPVAPQRYRPGKPVGNDDPTSESESESEEEEVQQAPRKTAPPKASSFPKISSDLQARQAAVAAAKAKELERQKADEEGFVTASESEDEEAPGSEAESEEEESEEEDSDSDEDRKPRFVAPTFVPKHKRIAIDPQAQAAKQSEDERYAEEERRRKEKADELLQAQIDRDIAIRAAGKKDWDDEDNVVDEVDDTDDVDPEAERAAWKLRELKRVKREREAIEEAEKEREEIERRRNLTAEEREAEDKEFLAKQAEEKGDKGQMGFMQKYFHKGAFFNGDEGEAGKELEALKGRDLMGARFEDDAQNRELLPQYMQIRDMTKLGKKGRTRYKDMKSEDTGRFGDEKGFRNGNGPDRYGGDREGPSGANAAAIGERRRREDDGQGRDDKRPKYDR